MLKRKLPGFTETNWTSSLRHYVGFLQCTEGPSDFVYNGDMEAFKSFFRLDNNKHWKVEYIEVKATTGSEKFFFHLSDRQFERALVPL